MTRLLVLLVALPAFAQQEPSAPPAPPTDIQPQPMPPPPAEAEQPTFAGRCFGYPSSTYLYVPVRPFIVTGVDGLPAATTGPGPSAASSGAGVGGGDAKALLILAVVAVAALPFVIYAFDSDAPAVVQQRFACPSFAFAGGVGVETSGSPPALLSASGRFDFGYSYFGADFQFDAGVVDAFAAHAMVRLKPRAHVEPSVALGYRHMALGSAARDGVEVGIPHRYVFWRSDLRTLALELRPTLMLGARGLDAGLEAALLVPLLEFLQFRIGTRVSSFGSAILWGGNAGLALTL